MLALDFEIALMHGWQGPARVAIMDCYHVVRLIVSQMEIGRESNRPDMGCRTSQLCARDRRPSRLAIGSGGQQLQRRD